MKTLSISKLSDRELLENICSRLISLEKIIGSTPVSVGGDWVTESQAAEILGYSKDYIRQARYRGVLTKVLTSAGGRKIKVSLKECEKKLILKIA